VSSSPLSIFEQARDPLIAVLVFGAAWFALFLYAWSTAKLASERSGHSSQPRFLWSLGCFFMIVHLLAAFDIYYDWSHAEALERTRSRSQALTGFDAGWGLYVNYAFVLLWIVDLAWWWKVGNARYRERPKWVMGLIHGFFLFMIFNSAFYFVQDWQRWIGMAIFAVGLVSVVMLIQRPASHVTQPSS